MTLTIAFVILLSSCQFAPSLSEDASKIVQVKVADTPKENSLDHVSVPKISADAIKLPEIPVLSPTPVKLPTPAVPSVTNDIRKSPVPCTCGVFLSGQFTRGTHSQPSGNPVLMQEYDDVYPCNAVGNKQCINKCLDVLAKHLHNSPTIICGAMDRDCYKERAYLWIQNCNATWINSNLSAGREYCCKGGTPYKCPKH